MRIGIHWTFILHDDPDACLALYCDTLGFDVGDDVADGGCAGSPAGRAGATMTGSPTEGIKTVLWPWSDSSPTGVHLCPELEALMAKT